MKILITLLALAPLASMANTCLNELEYKSLYQIEESKEFVIETEGWVTDLTDEIFAPFEEEGFERSDCQKAIYMSEFRGPSQTDYRAYYTYEDSCDGGNSHGYVLDVKTNKIIADIGDSEIICK
ncbi:hypothetical protein HBN50_11170 [Halobacteriovorax sp. GB3]|uniref:hypothetical protein n=1 Tax=Halobacteriovorax sp. GB3 TaxID=2719615 RepID=UPI0023630136|nr:hypothetical protein [Halobacteriovorax sp. GB3]MDD0853660.1 hypothetical protein [Halobacteriovorax sp. GB3]